MSFILLSTTTRECAIQTAVDKIASYLPMPNDCKKFGNAPTPSPPPAGEGLKQLSDVEIIAPSPIGGGLGRGWLSYLLNALHSSVSLYSIQTSDHPPHQFELHLFRDTKHFNVVIGAIILGLLISVSVSAKAEQRPIRLSEWLSARGISQDDYSLGLLWLVPGEKSAQAKNRTELLQSINANKGDKDATNRLIDWLARLPITGRVPISIVDADWLSANPKHDPVILENHQLILPKRPQTITLITSKGLRCQLPHVSGGLAKDYLAKCDATAVGRVDWAWLVQPDGVVKRFGIAAWNHQKQDEPAPGAWIWAPYRQDKWAKDVSPKLAAFLATQGVAADSVPNEESKLSSNLVILPKPVVENMDTSLVPIVSANDWGEAGLLQTPSARMRPTGNAAITYSRVDPYSRFNVFLQPFNWLEFGFRYSIMGNVSYGGNYYGNNQTYVDKSMDLKLSLLDESAYLPQVAFGFRDMTGTGMFSGEYVVANKRNGAFDWSLGIGWGYLGNAGGVRNPFSSISHAYSTRVVDVGQGGNFSVKSYFSGSTALFGGMQYQTLWEPVTLKLEFDGNNYQNEPLGNNLPQKSRWNYGAVYRAGDSLNFNLGFERGNTLMLGLTLQTDLPKLATPKLDDPAPIPVSDIRPLHSAIGESTSSDLTKQTGWSIRSIARQGREVLVNVEGAGEVYSKEYMNRANAVLNRDAANDVDFFSYLHRQHDLPIVEHRVDRLAWVQQQTQPLPPGEQRGAVTEQTIESIPVKSAPTQTFYRREPAVFEAEPGLNFIYNLGGPNGFVLYQLAAEERAKLQLNDNTWLQTRADLRLLDNYNNFTYDAPSNLPRVRTYIREYLTTSLVTLPNFQMTHTGKLSENQFYSAYGGYLESMYAGVGGEWLYRSLDSPIALGIDVNRVQQRDFNQYFGMRDYQVDTGHATLYWETGWNDLQANLSAGQYLAGDHGVTVEMTRVFQNGVRFGGWFSRTNLSPQQFGEGSFDKGIYVTIPFDAMLTKSSKTSGSFVWQPLLRDGGAKLQREVQLYDMTKQLSPRALEFKSADLENNIPVPSQK